MLLPLSVAVHLAFFFWGLYQDAHMVPRYTDVDYLVFTDAARFVANGQSPYMRDTYRYTPLLAWMLLPTYKYFNFGKLLFMLADLVAGALIIRCLKQIGYSQRKSEMYASVWLLNPMVCAISSRGSSEGLLAAQVMCILYSAMQKKYLLSGLLTGFAVHFKIYPFIYVLSILLSMEPTIFKLSKARIQYIFGCIFSFMLLTGLMYLIYGDEYTMNSWFYHLIRLDHRHNFSLYSSLLYYASSSNEPRAAVEKFAFVPQLLLSAVVIPLKFASKDLPLTMAVQTIFFVAYNKVCTSQYFLWYIVLLPFFIPKLKFRAGLVVSALGWVLFQGMWLHGAYKLEFLGVPAYNQLFTATVLFFLSTNWLALELMGIIS